jgi:hypothetical protein
MLLLAVVLRDAVPSTSLIARSNWWVWTGGFFGAVYIAISILLVPRLEAAAFIATQRWRRLVRPRSRGSAACMAAGAKCWTTPKRSGAAKAGEGQ